MNMEGDTLETVNIKDAIRAQVTLLLLQLHRYGRSLSIVWRDNTEILLVIVLFDQSHDCVHFFHVL